MPRTSMARPNGPRVRELRHENKWSQQELGRRSQHTHAVISYIESGRPVGEKLLGRVARALKVQLSDITLPEGDEDLKDVA